MDSLVLEEFESAELVHTEIPRHQHLGTTKAQTQLSNKESQSLAIQHQQTVMLYCGKFTASIHGHYNS